MKLRAVIVDDEPLARERLRRLLAEDEAIDVVAECRNGKETIAELKTEKVDLLFLDIQMPAGGGFEVIDEVGVRHMPATVFVTAYEQYAIQAFKVHAIDYLTKPIEKERLHETLERAKARIAGEAALQTQEQLTTALEALRAATPPMRGETAHEWGTQIVKFVGGLPVPDPLRSLVGCCAARSADALPGSCRTDPC